MAQNQYVNNFSLFDSLDFGGTSAPKIEPEYVPYAEPSRKKADNKKKASKTVKKSKAKTKQKAVGQTKEQKEYASYVKFVTMVGMCVAIVFVSMFAIMFGLNAQIDETATKIMTVQKQIDQAKNDQVRLESELDGLVSIDKIDDYALNVLGMIKLEDYKITYIGTEEDNHVVISGGKTYNDSITTRFIQLKEYFSK